MAKFPNAEDKGLGAPPGEYLIDGEELSIQLPTDGKKMSEKNVGMRTSSVAIIGRRQSGQGSVMRAEVAAAVGLPKLSRNRNSSINPARESFTTIRQRSRRNSMGPAHASSSSAPRPPEDNFSTFFSTADTNCKLPKLQYFPVHRVFVVSRIRNAISSGMIPSQMEVLDYLHSITIAKPGSLGKLTGYSLIYPKLVISVFEAPSEKIEETLIFLEKSSSMLENSRITLFLSDIPARILNTFVLLPIENVAAEQRDAIFPSEAAKLAKEFTDKVIQFSLLLSTLYKTDEDEHIQNASWGVEKAIINPEMVEALLRSDLPFPVSKYLQFCREPLHLSGLGDDFEWAYPPLSL